jgi:hypothetical protein
MYTRPKPRRAYMAYFLVANSIPGCYANPPQTLGVFTIQMWDLTPYKE